MNLPLTPHAAPPQPTRLGLLDVLSLGAHGMRTRPLRAALSALGIGIGIAAMVAVLAIPASNQKAVNDKLAKLGTNLLVANTGQTLSGTPAVLPKTAAVMARRIGPVSAATSVGVVKAAVYRSDKINAGDSGSLAVYAATPDLLTVLDGKVRTGTFLNAATGRYPAVVLGSVAAARLGIDNLDHAHPRQVWIGNHWFTVIGILAPMPLSPEIERSVLIGWNIAHQYLKFNQHPDRVYVRTDGSQIDAVRQVLGQTIDPQAPNEVQISRPSDALAARQLVDSSYRSLFLGLGAVALLVGGVGVANTMVISVLERRREIGLRRSLGATKRQIRGQFLTESVLLSGLGGVAGVMVGVLATSGYALSQHWPAVLPLTTLLGGVACSALVGGIAGAYPAMRAANLPPTQALA